MTAVAGSVFTAAQFNLHVRDNLNQTAPALATAAGQLFVATGLNAIATRSFTAATVATNETTTATTYGDLTTPGPAVTVTSGVSAIVMLYAAIANSGTGSSLASVAVSGASTVAAADGVSVGGTTSSLRCTAVSVLTGLNPGLNTFTMKYRVTNNTGTFIDRKITVLPL